MIQSHKITTGHLTTHYLESGLPEGDIVLLLHGNVSSSAFFNPLMEILPDDYRYLAPDMRNYGDSDAAPVDATRGVRDFSDDLHHFLEALNPTGRKVHLVGWSLGGSVIMQYAIDHPESAATLTLLSPMSPFGFGASRNTGITLEACDPDFAGSGAGGVSPNFLDCLRTQDGRIPSTQPSALQCNPQSHARTTMNNLYFKAAGGQTLLQQERLDAATEDLFTEAMFKINLGEDAYPGDGAVTQYWPGLAPGTRGINNSLSPKYCNLSSFATAGIQAPVLWVRGADDAIVSDASLLDINNLGKLGVFPGWPGDATHPPQPMVTQMRAVLDAYKANGGVYKEVIFENCGHSPHIEYPEKFLGEALDFWY